MIDSVRRDWIALSRPDIGSRERMALDRALGASSLSMGQAVEAFEAEFAAWVGRTYAVAVSSGTIGLAMVLQALGLDASDEVVASGYGWQPIGAATALCGARIVLADVEEESGCLGAETVASKIGENTRALLVRNANGHPAPWDELAQLSAACSLPLVEDSTESIGSRYQGRMTGGFGVASVFDFSLPSALLCGEGGMVVTDDPELATTLYALRSFDVAQRCAGEARPAALQARMSDLAAALGMAQLERIEEILASRKRVEALYRAEFSRIGGVATPDIGNGVDEVHRQCHTVRIDAGADGALLPRICAALERAGVEAMPYCPAPMEAGDLAVTERLALRTLVLPFDGNLTQAQVQTIAGALQAALEDTLAARAAGHLPNAVVR